MPQLSSDNFICNSCRIQITQKGQNVQEVLFAQSEVNHNEIASDIDIGDVDKTTKNNQITDNENNRNENDTDSHIALNDKEVLKFAKVDREIVLCI